MGSRCKVCGHEEREKIDLSLLAGVWTYAEIAQKFGKVSPSSVRRHRRNHLKEYVVSERGELMEEVARLMRREVLPELERLREDLAPRATLRRALSSFGLRSPGQRMLAVDVLTKALVDDAAWQQAVVLLILAGHDPDGSRSIVQAVAEGRGADPELVALELAWARPTAEEVP